MISGIESRLRRLHPDNMAIAQGILRVGFFVALASLCKMGKETAIAFRFGTSEQVDAYLFTFNIINWPLSIWLSILTVTLVPLLAGNSSGEDKRLLAAELLGLTLVMSCGALVIGNLGLPFLLVSDLAGLPASTSAFAVRMVPGLMLLVPLGAVVGILSAWLLASSRHVNSLLEGVPALVLAGIVLLVPASPENVLVWGVVAGFIFHVIALGGAIKPKDWLMAPRFRRASKEWPALWKGMSIMVIGQALMTCASLLDQFFAARMDTGSISTLSYANRVLTLILMLGSVSISRGMLPIFSKRTTREDDARARVFGWSAAMFLVGAGAAFGAWLLSPFLVKVLFERGAFTPANTITVAEALRFGALQLPFYFSGLVLVAFLASHRRYKVLTVIGGINLVVKCVANIILVPKFGLNALMISTALMCLSSTLALYASTLRRWGAKEHEN